MHICTFHCHQSLSISNVTLFAPSSAFADVINSVAEVTMRSMVLTITCMALVCAVTIMSVGETAIAIVCISNAGVIMHLRVRYRYANEFCY